MVFSPEAGTSGRLNIKKYARIETFTPCLMQGFSNNICWVKVFLCKYFRATFLETKGVSEPAKGHDLRSTISRIL